MKKTVLSLVTLSALLTLAGCSSSTPVEATPELVIPQETTTQVADHSGWESYTDMTGGFSFSYPKTRKFSIEKEKDDMSDSQHVMVQKSGYYLHISEYNKPREAECANLLTKNKDFDPNAYKKMSINGIDVMRDLNDNYGDCSNEDQLGAGVQLSIYYATGTIDSHGLTTASSCLGSGKKITIDYGIELDDKDVATCSYDKTIVEEMDAIASTLKW